MEPKPTLTTAVFIPLATAVITGVACGLLAAALSWPGLLIGLAAGLAAWIFRPGAVQLPAIELPAGNNEQTVKLHIISEGGHVGDFVELGIDQDRLQRLAVGLVSGKGLDVRTWTGRGALFSQSEFAKLRGELIGRGLARWVSDRDPRSGCVLTSKGKATFSGLAALPPPPHSPIKRQG